MSVASGGCRRVMQAWSERLPLQRKVATAICAEGWPAYLVGGTVRDALLGRESYDLDISIAGPARQVARRVADRLYGAYVPLDDARDVARVVLSAAGKQHHVDIAALRGDSIEADLWGRDFTINAMAVPLHDGLGELLDPTGGQADLALRVLRIVREDAFDDDPARILRGVRLRGALGFAVTRETEVLARVWLPALERVSPERVRDELLQVLALDDAAESLAYAGELGVLGSVLPEMQQAEAGVAHGRPGWCVGTGVVGMLEALFADWTLNGYPSGHPRDDALEDTLGHHLADLAEHWAGELSSGRERWVLLKLAAFLSALRGAPARAAEVAERLHLSTREVRFVRMSLSGSRMFLSWNLQEKFDPLRTYRYYRTTDDAGVDGAVLGLCFWRALCVPEAEPGAEAAPWRALLERAKELIDAWYEVPPEMLDPPQLVTGRDIVHGLQLLPGPLVGRLLERVREAQVQGLVRTREEALAYLCQAHSKRRPNLCAER